MHMKKTIFTLFLSLGASSLFARAHFTYLQRFESFVNYTAATHGDKAQDVIRRARNITSRHPWLLELTQPTATYNSEEVWYVLARKNRNLGLPDEIYSTKRIILNYDDGKVVQHIYVSPQTPDYEIFRELMRTTMPAVVTVGDNQDNVDDDYLYSERALKHLTNMFADSGFSFEAFLTRVRSPLLNVATGGYNFSRKLFDLEKSLQDKLYRDRDNKRFLDVFSLDLSGGYHTYQANPLYLFGDMYATGLPDDTFGAVLALGGPLKRTHIGNDEGANILAELGRISIPNGRLLVEYAIPTPEFVAMLGQSGLSYQDYTVYQGHEHPNGGRIINLMEILLDKDFSASAP